MSKISTALRAAALGPAPRANKPHIIVDWLPLDHYARSAANGYRNHEFFSELAENEQRMYLLFVAEAEE